MPVIRKMSSKSGLYSTKFVPFGPEGPRVAGCKRPTELPRELGAVEGVRVESGLAGVLMGACCFGVDRADMGRAGVVERAQDGRMGVVSWALGWAAKDKSLGNEALMAGVLELGNSPHSGGNDA
mmetsp:Transcript_94021/g.303704  ORF Transcript_94021/g.303704 Transcript_94021/m.303704 type:complete len:124 (+) Transcript_94021:462-833(+)